MAFMPFLHGDTRSTSLSSLIRCTLDECHRDLQTVLEQAVQGDDESRYELVAIMTFISNALHAALDRK